MALNREKCLDLTPKKMIPRYEESKTKEGFRNSDGSLRNAKVLLGFESASPIKTIKF